MDSEAIRCKMGEGARWDVWFCVGFELAAIGRKHRKVA